MTKNVAVFGLGSMGFGMAQSCLRSGFFVHGFDVDTARMAQFAAEGGAAGALSEVAPSLQAVIIVVLNAEQAEAVLFGADGVVPRLPTGAVVLSCATVPPDFAKRMAARCGRYDVHYLDAPVSGGAAKAAAGHLSIMASGAPKAFSAAEPVLAAISDTVFRLGDAAGAGSAMKAVNQLLAGVHIATMAEAMAFGITQGITPDAFIDVIPKCAGTSWMLENRAPHIVAGDYTPLSQTRIWPKDLGIVLEAAKEAGFNAPIVNAALARYTRAVEMGLGHEDDASVAKVYAREAGITLPGEEI